MDTMRLIEDYEARHAKDDYTTDLELILGGLNEDETDSKEMYSPKWAERQITFLADYNA